MKPSRINLRLLRQLPKKQSSTSGIVQALSDKDLPNMSRRSLLKMSGIAAVSATPLLRRAGSLVFGPFELVQTKDSAEIVYAGQTRWRIDARNYSGSPELQIQRSESLLSISLKNARFPGTSLAADFHCEIRAGLGSWKMSYDASLGNFHGVCAFEQWLLGLAECRSRVSLSETICSPTSQHSISLNGRATASVRTDNSWTVDAKNIATLLPWNALSDSVTIRPAEELCYIQDAPKRRTRLTFDRAEKKWEIDTNSQPSTHWNVFHDDTVFDHCVVDCCESSALRTQVAMVFESLNTDAVAAVEVFRNVLQGTDCTLPLQQPRFALLFSAGTVRSSFVANFGTDPTWLHQPGISYHLGARENTSPFEIHSIEGRIAQVKCEPSILRVMPHIGDVICSPVEINDDVALAFSGYGAVRSFKEQREQFVQTISAAGLGDGSVLESMNEDVYQLQKSGTKGYQIAKLGSKTINVKTELSLKSISIIRPQDLLVLTFYYDNFSIQGSATGASLVPTDSSKTGTIVVEFPPQNIIEQAFYDAENPVDKNTTYNPATGGTTTTPLSTTSDALPQPPIKARMSGKSRLAFQVPKGSSIDLSLDALLQWEQWTPALVPVAQRADSSSSSGFYLYPGLISYLNKQGIRFKSGALMNDISAGGASLSMNSIEEGLSESSLSKFRSNGLEYSSKFSSSTGVSARKYSAKSSARATSKSASDFRYALNYSDLTAKYNAGFYLMKPTIREPLETETALEIPYRLMLSPMKDSGWAHARKQKTRSLNLKRTDASGTEHSETVDFTELWHTRLWFKTKNKDGSYSVNERDNNYLLQRKPKIRAVWSPDFVSDRDAPTHNFPPWSLSSLTSKDRWAMVINSSDWYAQTKNPKTQKTTSYEPKAIDSEKLFLSSIGAWIDIHGAWDPVPSNVDVVDWIHRGTMGREHYVRVMYRGYLFPFGHKCTLVKITERKFGKPKTRGTYGAYMRQRMFVIVRQPDMILDDTNTLFEHEGREFPFKKVHIKDLVTPNIEKPGVDPGGLVSTDSGYGFPNEFYIRVSGEDFKFHCRASDWDGNEIDFVQPMAFVLGSISNTSVPEARKVVDYLNTTSETNARRAIDLNGARVAFAASKNKGDTTFETTSLVLESSFPDPPPKDVTWFYPKLKSAQIRHQDVERMSGSSGNAKISFVTKFLESGFDQAANAGEAFLQLADHIPMNFGGSGGGSSDKSGGFISPNQAIMGLSRAIGPISGQIGKGQDAIDKYTNSSFNFDPADFLGAFDAKLFGVISLFDIIQAVTGSDPRTTLLPQLLSKAVPGLGNPADLLNTLKNSVMKPINDAYSAALADATATSSSILAKLQEMKDLIDGLQSHVTALETAISSASGTGDIFTALTTTLPEFLNWITTNLGPLGVIPQDAMNTIQDVAKVLENMQNGIRIGFDWKPRMQADEYGFFVPQDPDDTFALSAYALLPLSNKDHTLTVGDPTAKVEGYLQNFSINLIPTVMDLVSLPIVKMGFSAEVGKKSDIYCNLGSMEWRGPLAFMNELQKFIPLDGFVDPPSIDVDMTGIKINFDLAIPTISVGVFAITNISLGAGLTLPFLGDSMLFKFDFCKKDSPFHVTYMMLGGGGYFGLTLSLDGVEKIEAAIEIGAELALDFGVASGNVSIFAGIYFSMEGDVMTLQGYVKIHGEVDVLGLISASLTLEMTITYISTGKLYGTATLTIEIHLFIFSASVDITVEKYFKGSAGDPMIAQMIPDELYPGSSKKYFELYLGAFA